MNWLNISITTLRTPEYIGSSPTERGTWLSLLGYCADQENGGRVAGGASWKDRQWQQTCGVTLREIRAASKLITIDGDDVVVFAYLPEKEAEIKARRASAKEASIRRWGNPSSDSPSNPSSDKSTIRRRNAEGEGEGEGERNENEKEGCGEGASASPPPSPDAPGLDLGLPAPPAPKPPKPPTAAAQTDAEWLAELKTSPAFAGIDVEREQAKCVQWCKLHAKQPTRRRLLNWLNRCDKPIAGNGRGPLMR